VSDPEFWDDPDPLITVDRVRRLLWYALGLTVIAFVIVAVST
jgi:hypothetical protein